MQIRKILLNLILTEKEKVIISESLDDRMLRVQTSMGESFKDLCNDIYELRVKIKTKTKRNTYYEL